MGYDVSITRINGDETTIAIPEKEWLAYVETDTELEFSQMTTEGSPYLEWTKHPEFSSSEEGRPWFHWGHGSIYTKNPDEQVLIKMFQIATALDAQVQGQDGELYDEDGLQMNEVHIQEEPLRKIPKSKPWWRFW